MYSELANWDGSRSPPKQPARRRSGHSGNAKASSSMASASASSSSAGTTAPTTPAYIASTSPSAATSNTSLIASSILLDDKTEIDGVVGVQGDISVEAERLFVPNHLLLPPSPAKESTPRTPAAPKAAARSKPQPGTRIILYSPQAVDERQDGDDEDFVHFMLEDPSPLPHTAPMLISTPVPASPTRKPANILNLPSKARSTTPSTSYQRAATPPKPLFWQRSSSPMPPLETLFTPPPSSTARKPMRTPYASPPVQSIPRSPPKRRKRPDMAYVDVPSLPKGTTKADYYDGGDIEKRRLDALVRDARLARQPLPIHPLQQTYGTSWKGKERAIDIVDDSDDSDFRPSKPLKRKAQDLDRDRSFSSLQPPKKKHGRKPRAAKSASNSVPSSSRQGTQSVSVPPAQSISASGHQQVVARSVPSSSRKVPPAQSISAGVLPPSAPAGSSRSMAISPSTPDIPLSLSQAIPVPKSRPKPKPLPEQRTLTFENFDHVIWPSEEWSDATDSVILPFNEWPDTTLLQTFSSVRHLREKKGLPPPTTYQQAIELVARPGSPRMKSKPPTTPSIDMGPALYGTPTTGTHGGGMTFSGQQYDSGPGSEMKKVKGRAWDAGGGDATNDTFLHHSSLAVEDDADTDPDAEGDIDMDYYINDLDVTSGTTSHIPAPDAATLNVLKFIPRGARLDVLPPPAKSKTSFPPNGMHMPDGQVNFLDTHPNQLNETDPLDTNTFSPDLGDTANDPFVSPGDYDHSSWMPGDGDASSNGQHPNAHTQHGWNGTIDPSLLGGGETLEPATQSPTLPAFQSVKRIPRRRHLHDMVPIDDVSLSASEFDYEGSEFNPGREFARAGSTHTRSSNQWEESTSSSSSWSSKASSPKPDPVSRTPIAKRPAEPQTKGNIVWESGPLNSCHQCRNTTTLAKMQCSQVKSNGDPCRMRFCVRCVQTRYDAPFDSTSKTFVCFKCHGTCNCTTCARKRGEVYVGVRSKPRLAPSLSSLRTTSPPPRPMRKAIVHAPPPDNPTKHWGTIYGLSGEKIGTAFVGEDDGDDARVVVPRMTGAAQPPMEPKPRKRIFIGALSSSWNFQNPVVKEISVAKKRKRKGNAIIREYIGNKPPRVLKAPTLFETLPGDETNFEGPASPGSAQFSLESSLTPLSTPSPDWPAPAVGESAHFGYDVERPAVGDGGEEGVTSELHIPDGFNLSPNKMESVIQAALSAAALT